MGKLIMDTLLFQPTWIKPLAKIEGLAARGLVVSPYYPRAWGIQQTTMKVIVDSLRYNGGSDVVADIFFYNESDGSYVDSTTFNVPRTDVVRMGLLFDNIKTNVLSYASSNSYSITALDIIWPMPIGFSSGVEKLGIVPYVSSATVAGGAGVVRFYLTDDGTSTGNAAFSEIDTDSIQVQVFNSSAVYVPASVTVDTNKKYIDVTMNKLNFTTGLAGILSVLIGAALGPAANGTVVKCLVMGR